MRFSFSICALLLLNAAAAIGQEEQQSTTEIAVQWHWDVVSTPDFYGPFRGTDAGFRNPKPKQPLPMSLRLTHDKEPFGVFEALVGVEGVTMPERTISVSSQETERVVNEILSKWRFAPATLDGKPIRVRLRVHLNKKIG